MTTPIAELIDQLGSADFNARALALAELVEQGTAATAALLTALDSPDEGVRGRVIRGLAEIADPVSADTLAGALGDSSSEVRARAAQGLARIGDPRAIDALVRTIDDFPDVLHHPYTLSVHCLIDLGPSALPAVAPLLKADDPATREHAFLVIRSVVERLPEGAGWDRLWRSLGSFDARGDDPGRDRAADDWLTWIRRRPA